MVDNTMFVGEWREGNRTTDEAITLTAAGSRAAKSTSGVWAEVDKPMGTNGSVIISDSFTSANLFVPTTRLVTRFEDATIQVATSADEDKSTETSESEWLSA